MYNIPLFELISLLAIGNFFKFPDSEFVTRHCKLTCTPDPADRLPLFFGTHVIPGFSTSCKDTVQLLKSKAEEGRAPSFSIEELQTSPGNYSPLNVH